MIPSTFHPTTLRIKAESTMKVSDLFLIVAFYLLTATFNH